MKQLTIYCGEELNETITQLLHKHSVESFMHLPEIYGNTVKPKGSYEKDMVWPASAFILFIDGQELSGIMSDLKEFANKCRVKPCLRLAVTPVEELY